MVRRTLDRGVVSSSLVFLGKLIFVAASVAVLNQRNGTPNVADVFSRGTNASEQNFAPGAPGRISRIHSRTNIKDGLDRVATGRDRKSVV